jgi:hypothetical protein
MKSSEKVIDDVMHCLLEKAMQNNECGLSNIENKRNILYILDKCRNRVAESLPAL